MQITGLRSETFAIRIDTIGKEIRFILITLIPG